MIERFSHVMLWAQDLATAVSWYCSHFGYEVSYQAEGEFASLYHAQLGRLDLHGGARPEDLGRGPMPYYIVADIQKTTDWLRSLGVFVEDPQQVGESPRHTWFRDCAGNLIGLSER